MGVNINYEKILESRRRFDTPMLFDVVESLQIEQVLYVFPLGNIIDTDSLSSRIMDEFEFIEQLNKNPLFIKGYTTIICSKSNKVAQNVEHISVKQENVKIQNIPTDKIKIPEKYKLRNYMERLAFGDVKYLIRLFASHHANGDVQDDNIDFAIKLYCELIESFREAFISIMPELDMCVDKMLSKMVEPIEERNLMMSVRKYLKPNQVNKFLNILWRLGLAKSLIHSVNKRVYWKLTKPINQINSEDISARLAEIIR